MLGDGFFGGEVFDELDDLETLSRRELQERAKQAQTFHGAACGRAELKVQFSREIEVLHLAPMTSIGLRDQTSMSRSTAPGRVSTLNHVSRRTGPTEQVVTMPRNNSPGKPNRRRSDASSASHHGNSG